MRRLALLCFACALALALPGRAAATQHGGTHGSPMGPLLQERAAIGQCGLPSPGTWWIDFASLDTERELSRAGVIVGASTGTYPARLRAAGAKTVYWDMYLNRRVGQPSAPANPDTIETRANSLFDFAATPERLREADHRAQRALRRTPRDAVDGEQPALPRERARVRAAARLARRAAVPAHLDPPVHRQRRGGRPGGARSRRSPISCRRSTSAGRRCTRRGRSWPAAGSAWRCATASRASSRSASPRRASVSCSASRRDAEPAVARGCNPTRPGTR